MDNTIGGMVFKRRIEATTITTSIHFEINVQTSVVFLVGNDAAAVAAAAIIVVVVQ